MVPVVVKDDDVPEEVLVVVSEAMRVGEQRWESSSLLDPTQDISGWSQGKEDHHIPSVLFEVPENQGDLVVCLDDFDLHWELWFRRVA